MPLIVKLGDAETSVTYSLKEERQYILQILFKKTEPLPNARKRDFERRKSLCGKFIIITSRPFKGKDWNEKHYHQMKLKYSAELFVYQIIRPSGVKRQERARATV
jgi:hypothetical protein